MSFTLLFRVLLLGAIIFIALVIAAAAGCLPKPEESEQPSPPAVQDVPDAPAVVDREDDEDDGGQYVGDLYVGEREEPSDWSDTTRQQSPCSASSKSSRIIPTSICVGSHRVAHMPHGSSVSKH